jgi:HSP20 family molecular chaperone IbpA
MYRDIMKIDWDAFNAMFPNYYDHKTIMWSESKETDTGFDIKIVIPGFDKEDFNLYEENGVVQLSIKKSKDKTDVYDVLYDSEKYDLDKMSAEYKAGILKIKIPKQIAQKKSRREIGIS